MTKTIIKRNDETKTGYELIIQTDGQKDVIIPINDHDPKNEDILKLPENPSNRKWFSKNKIKGDSIELTYKESMTFGPRGESSPRKPLEDYLDEADKILYLELVEKAKKRREELTRKPKMTEREKIEAKIARLQNRLDSID
jgi:hypothetical protein